MEVVSTQYEYWVQRTQFCVKEIRHSFKKTGIHPFNEDAVPQEADASSHLSSKPPTLSYLSNITLMTVPSITVRSSIDTPETDAGDSSAKFLAPPNELTTSVSEPSTSTWRDLTPVDKPKEIWRSDKDWDCDACGVSYWDDARQRAALNLCNGLAVWCHAVSRCGRQIVGKWFACDKCCGIESEAEECEWSYRCQKSDIYSHFWFCS